MAGLCDGRVVIVTGAGRGIGRAHALALAAEGASVVVNDYGGKVDGSGWSDDPASLVVKEIVDVGGKAIPNGNDVSDEAGARGLIDQAIAEFGTLDAVINNAGILRDSMLFNMEPEQWDAVIKVHLRPVFLTSQYAASIWRERFKAGENVDARIINTTSVSGLYGNIGQTNYGAAKAGVAAFSVIAARELKPYGITVNAISPNARTRMTEGLFDDGDAMSLTPDHVGKVGAFLASKTSRHITGRVIGAFGRELSVLEGWSHGPEAVVAGDATPAQVGETINDLFSRARPNYLVDGHTLETDA